MDREEEEESKKEWEGNNMRAKEMDERTLNGWEKLAIGGQWKVQQEQEEEEEGEEKQEEEEQEASNQVKLLGLIRGGASHYAATLLKCLR